MYDDNAPRAIANGYHTLPISPVGFKPEKSPVRFEPGYGKFVLLKGWTTQPSPFVGGQPGANIGVRCGNGLVNFDYDDDDAALKISEAFESSPVCKAGKRAFAPFYRADFPVPSEDFYDSDGQLVLQILSDGKQCVIPPSVHPETKQPYRWTNGHSLYDTPLSELPLLPPDYRERLERLGYASSRKPKKPETELAGGDKDEHDDRFNEIKQAALRNLAAWVPDLGLYGLKRNAGRGASFRSVASFRPSKTGRPNEQRDLNLNIHPRGITDEGDNGKGYSAIDLVMVCLNCTNVQALEWIEEKLLPPKPDVKVDWEKLGETQDAPKTAPDDDDSGGAKEATPKRRRINPMPLILPAERDVPRRDFLYGMHYMRGTVSGTIGTGGTGKSTLGLIEAIGMAVGRDLLGIEKFKKPLRVWYHNAEETMDELTRRCVAICKHFKISQDDLGNNLLITNGFETPIKVAGGGRDVKIDSGLRKEIIDVIDEMKIDVVIFDPLVAMHRIHEDFNSALDPVIRDALAGRPRLVLLSHWREEQMQLENPKQVRSYQELMDSIPEAKRVELASKLVKIEAAAGRQSRRDTEVVESLIRIFRILEHPGHQRLADRLRNLILNPEGS